MGSYTRGVKKLVEAEGYLELGLPHKAVGVLEAIGSVPDLQFQHSRLMGEALRGLQQDAAAIEWLERARKLNDEDIHVLLALGWCYKRTSQLPRAIEVLEHAHRLEREDALVQYNLACYCSLAGHAERAIDWLRRALRRKPEMRHGVDGEPDFDPIRDHPEFQRVISRHEAADAKSTEDIA